MTRVHIIGAAGYAAAEAVRYLHAHPFFELGVLESRSLGGERLGDHFPLLRTMPYRCSDAGSVARTLRAGDAVIVAGSDEGSRAVVPPLLREDVRVVDLSSAYRASSDAIVWLERVARLRDCRSEVGRESRLLSDCDIAGGTAARVAYRSRWSRRFGRAPDDRCCNRCEERHHRRRTHAENGVALCRSQRRYSCVRFERASPPAGDRTRAAAGRHRAAGRVHAAGRADRAGDAGVRLCDVRRSSR